MSSSSPSVTPIINSTEGAAAYPIAIITGTSNPALAKTIGEALKIPLIDANVKMFADGEVSVCIQRPVRGSDLFIVQSLCPPDVNRAIMELLLMIDAAQRASAKRVVAVIPYYGYCRQDRKAHPHTPISAKLVADIICTAGADRIICIDLHAPQIQGFFPARIQVDHLFGYHIFARYLNEHLQSEEKIAVVTPDAGGTNRARELATRIGAPIAIIDKRRPRANECEIMHVIGDVKDHYCILVDDIADTAGTLCQAATALVNHGASGVSACVTHALLSGEACERIRDSCMKSLICLDTVPVTAEKQRRCGGKVSILSCAQLLAMAMKAVHYERSVGQMMVEATPHLSVQERKEEAERRRSTLAERPPEFVTEAVNSVTIPEDAPLTVESTMEDGTSATNLLIETKDTDPVPAKTWDLLGSPIGTKSQPIPDYIDHCPEESTEE